MLNKKFILLKLRIEEKRQKEKKKTYLKKLGKEASTLKPKKVDFRNKRQKVKTKTFFIHSD